MANYVQSLTLLRKIYEYFPNQEREDDTTILSIFNKSFNEDAISDYLAYLLHPKLNGIGHQPLEELILAAGGEWQPDYNEMIDEITINREYTLNNGRRIDLLIELADQLVVGIEHKVFSEEHRNQTVVYAEEIKAEFPDHQHVFIFLSHDKRKALAYEEFKAIGYEDLVKLLKKVTFDYLKNIKKAVLFEDFIMHLEENFMSNNQYALSEKSRLYLEHFQMLEDLQKSFDQDYSSVLDFIMNFLKNALENKFETQDEWKINSSPKRGYQQIAKENWKTKGLDIHFELALSRKKFATSERIEFMIDIEGSRKQAFVEELDKKFATEIESVVKAKGLDKNTRARITFVSKEYPLFTNGGEPDQVNLQEQLESMVNDFHSFVSMIDEAMTSFFE